MTEGTTTIEELREHLAGLIGAGHVKRLKDDAVYTLIHAVASAGGIDDEGEHHCRGALEYVKSAGHINRLAATAAFERATSELLTGIHTDEDPRYLWGVVRRLDEEYSRVRGALIGALAALDDIGDCDHE